MSDASPVKLAVMSCAAVAAIVIAIVVGMKTFSDGSSSSVSPSTEPITGTWQRLAEQPTSDGGPSLLGPMPGMGMNSPGQGSALSAKTIKSVDASSADSGSISLSLDDGKTITGKVLSAQPGFLLVQIEGDKGASTVLNLGQLGNGGPLVISDGTASVHFGKP